MASSAASQTKSNIKVLYFATASTATGTFSESIPIPDEGLLLTDLPALLITRHADTKRELDLDTVLKTSAWSLNHEMVQDEDLQEVRLKAGDEVAVIPPVSGG